MIGVRAGVRTDAVPAALHPSHPDYYFLDPEYLSCSQYFVGVSERLREFVVERAQHRLYLDVANSVIVSLRESIKKNRVQAFTDPEALLTREMALRALIDLGFGEKYRNLSDQALSSARIAAAFHDTLRTMTGETIGTGDRLGLGAGQNRGITQPSDFDELKQIIVQRIGAG